MKKGGPKSISVRDAIPSNISVILLIFYVGEDMSEGAQTCIIRKI
jgi:hypothetical protein